MPLTVDIDTGCSIGSVWVSKGAIKKLGKSSREIWKLDQSDGRVHGPDVNGNPVRPKGKIRLSFRFESNGTPIEREFYILPDQSPYEVVFGNSFLDEANAVDWDQTWQKLQRYHETAAGTFGGFGSNSKESKGKRIRYVREY